MRKGKEAYERNKLDEAKKYFQGATYVSPEMAHELIKVSLLVFLLRHVLTILFLRCAEQKRLSL